jgi:hypothetical protein
MKLAAKKMKVLHWLYKQIPLRTTVVFEFITIWEVVGLSEIVEKFHRCATCVHFVIHKEGGRTQYKCSRLGYETHPKYKFHCWKPKERIRKLMDENTKE